VFLEFLITSIGKDFEVPLKLSIFTRQAVGTVIRVSSQCTPSCPS